MILIAWIIVGFLAGLLARWIVRDDKAGCLYTIAVGVLGALIGGALMQARTAGARRRSQTSLAQQRNDAILRATDDRFLLRHHYRALQQLLVLQQ